MRDIIYGGINLTIKCSVNLNLTMNKNIKSWWYTDAYFFILYTMGKKSASFSSMFNYNYFYNCIL